MQNKQPRAHHDIIIAWANGAEIQHRRDASMAWKDCADPAFIADYQYRVKPEREYPKTQLSDVELKDAYDPEAHIAYESMVKCRKMVNAALRAAIDAGQVVTREEFAKVTAELKHAQASAFVYQGIKHLSTFRAKA
jgi:hypothetical protein